MRRSRRTTGFVGGLVGSPAVVSALVLLVAAPTATAARPESVLATFSTPGNHTFTVPKGVKRVRFEVFGAQGGGSGGGLGGEADATFATEPGRVFQVVVGGTTTTTTGGFNGGGSGGESGVGRGGGGGTDVRACAPATTCGLADRIIVAGGGGGDLPDGVGGGHGGGLAGTGAPGSTGGGGGTQTSGGVAGSTHAQDGAFGLGGDGFDLGGGGGGGWFGGGGGGDPARGGGGGSGHISGLALFGSMQTGVETGNGRVIVYKGGK